MSKEKIKYIKGYNWNDYYKKNMRTLEYKEIEDNFNNYIKNNLIISDELNKKFLDSFKKDNIHQDIFPNQLDILLLGKFLDSTAFTNIKDRTFINNLVILPKVAEKLKLVKSTSFTRYSIYYDKFFLTKPEENENMSFKIEIPEKDYISLNKLNLLERIKIMLEDKESPIYIYVPIDSVMEEFIQNFITQLEREK